MSLDALIEKDRTGTFESSMMNQHTKRERERERERESVCVCVCEQRSLAMLALCLFVCFVRLNTFLLSFLLLLSIFLLPFTLSFCQSVSRPDAAVVVEAAAVVVEAVVVVVAAVPAATARAHTTPAVAPLLMHREGLVTAHVCGCHACLWLRC